MQSFFEFQYSPWLVPVCLVAGITYAWLQYSRKAPWSSSVNWGLAVARTLLVTILGVLLLGPTARLIKNYYEDPVIVLAMDDSESIALGTDSTSLAAVKGNLTQILEQMQDAGWDVHLVNLANEETSMDSIDFSSSRTNLTGMVKGIQQEYAKSNLGAILVVTDGIFNSGYSPDLIKTDIPVYALGLGDTIPRKDLSIIDIDYNKTVYQGNRFPVGVTIRNTAMGPGETLLKIYLAGKFIDQRKINIEKNERIVQDEFLLDPEEAGKQRIQIELVPISGEATDLNNRANIYVDVVEGKQKILILSDAPSPTVRAIRLAMASSSQFEVTYKSSLIGITEMYDLIVLVNTPKQGITSSVYNLPDKYKEVPRFFILGTITNWTTVARDKVIDLPSGVRNFDKVTAMVNSDFTGFSLPDELNEWLKDVPPVTVPFTDLTLGPNDIVVLNQRVGSLATDKPLFYINNSDPKKGIFFGADFWKWRLDEFRRFGETTRFDEMIAKAIKYLAARPDKRQFKIYPSRDGFEVGEEMKFVVETYNELFEPYFGDEVTLTITGNGKNWLYNFTPLAGSREFTIDDLPEGLFSYSAHTMINGKRHAASGQFIVEKPDIESADLTADYSFLRSLSEESGGRFYTFTGLQELQDDLLTLDAKAIIHSQEREVLLFSLPWILVALITLVTGEWLVRKMMGGY